MRNGPALPLVSIVAALVLSVIVMATHGAGPLAPLELGAVAWAVTLAIYGTQGIISVLMEGQELEPGRVAPRLTGPLSMGIVVLSLALFGVAVLLAYAITAGWSPSRLGGIAGGGCMLLALVLIAYKEAFVGDEASFDRRDDGVPW